MQVVIRDRNYYMICRVSLIRTPVPVANTNARAFSGFIPSSMMVPPRRFQALLDQSFHYQRSQCLYHNISVSTGVYSLFSDHRCNRDMFPRVTTTILQGHTDEVWNLAWSHDGKWLATASKDKTIIVWSFGVGALLGPPILTGAHVSYFKSEPEQTIKAEWTLKEHNDPVGCLAWSLDGTILLSSSEQVIKMWNMKVPLAYAFV